MKTVGRTLRKQSPQIDRAVSTGWRLYKRFYFRLLVERVTWASRNEAEIDPYRIFWVDPERIEYLSKPLPKRRFRYAGGSTDGALVGRDMRFEETEIYRFIYDRFGRGLDWNDIELFDVFIDRIERGTRLWDCTSKSAFERRCRELEQLYENIEKHGFKTQAELVDGGAKTPLGADHFSKLDRFIRDEMAINIGRRGDLLAYEGQNRLTIAKLLDVDAIPVRVLVRHPDWQRFRTSLMEDGTDLTEVPPALRSHPDLQHIESNRNRCFEHS